MKHANLKITGKVQGVFFRAEAKKKADELGLSGFVQNMEDGSVYAEVEGEDSLITEFINWIKTEGPELAKIDKVEVNKVDSLKDFQKFLIF